MSDNERYTESEIMSKEEIIDIKVALLWEIDKQKQNTLEFKRRISIMINMVVVGLGFVAFGNGFLKGFITSVLFYGYTIFFVSRMLENLGGFATVIFYTPAIIVWVVSQCMIMGLEE